MYAAAKCLLFRLDPETAHQLSLAALKTGLPFAPPRPSSPRLEVRAAGLDFPNPLGIAAGYDKNGEVFAPLLKMGFGFVEVGTVTPLPQPGNPKPRLFRLPRDRAVINRLGFNNEGHGPMLARLKERREPGIVGVNLGANKDSVDRIADYVAGIAALGPAADYITINISSPNTPGLRDLQARTHLRELLERCIAAREALDNRKPLLLKVSPDLDAEQLEDVATSIEAFPVDGLIVSNTTIQRQGLSERQHAAESGGLSGAPLFLRATILLARLRRRLGPAIALIGAGGVDSPETAFEKIRAGADLLQIYTGLVYGGPGLPSRILAGLDRLVTARGAKSIRELRDSGVSGWADRPLV